MSGFSVYHMMHYSLYSFVEHSPDPIYILGTDKKVIYANSVFVELYGWTTQELNENDFPHVPPELREELTQMFIFIDQGQPLFALDTFRIKRSGELISVKITISPIKNPEGRITAYICVLRDITEMKFSELKYYKLFNEANDPIFIYEQDKDGKPSKLLDVNEAACRMLGYTRQELLDKTPDSIAAGSLVHEIGNIFEIILSGDGIFVEGIQVAKDGKQIPVEISAKPIKLNGRMLVISIARDMTERKKTEEYLRYTESISMIGELSAGIAHEIRNPLTSIRGFVQLLFAQSKMGREFHEIILSEVDRINSIIGELLLLGKESPSDQSDCNLVQLVRQVVVLLNAQAHMTDNEIVLRTELTNLPLRCADNKLKQVFINILKNAIEASPRGAEITVELNREEDTGVIRIADTGQGIPNEVLNRIGLPFFTTKSEGNGLGVMISRKIINNHKGTLLFKANTPSGTIVEITLPVL
ncbi:Adaptive-response sensory-kinase SasA [Paenibacillus auburnensis]|uniref:histidine kinase n=2 Tax=Paenibacillus auburnensis TaxID=2905649 RepID=A0ABM9C8S9_9BACL|nr:Adaptive-response sensory-kinase SasA [Paenibacillus auburnensis]